MNKYTAIDLSNLSPVEALEVLKGLPEKERGRLMHELLETNKDFAADIQAEAMVENLNRNVLDEQ